MTAVRAASPPALAALVLAAVLILGVTAFCKSPYRLWESTAVVTR